MNNSTTEENRTNSINNTETQSINETEEKKEETKDENIKKEENTDLQKNEIKEENKKQESNVSNKTNVKTEQVSSKPANKDFLFTDGYTMENVTQAAQNYLTSSGYAGECNPIKDNEGVYLGMRVTFY